MADITQFSKDLAARQPGTSTPIPPYDGSLAGTMAKPAVVTSVGPAAKTTQNIADLTVATKNLTPATGNIINNQYVNPKGILTDARTGQPVLVKTPEGAMVDSQGTVITPAPEKPITATDKAIKEAAGVTTTTTTTQPVKSQAQIDAEQGIADTRTQIETLQKTMDARSAAIIANITAEYDNLVKQQEIQNTAYQGGVTTEGIVSGRERYAPVMQAGIINSAISAGLQSISQIQAKKQGLILQAENARDEKNFKLLNKTMQNYRDTVKEERKIAQDTYENALKASKEARDVAKQNMDEQKVVISEARNTLNALITNFGGIDIESLDPVSKQTITELATTAGMPLEIITGPSLKEQTTENTLKQQRITNAIAAAGLSIRQATFAQSQEIDAQEAQRLNLPRSVVGMNEAKINADLKLDTPPVWFIESKILQGEVKDINSPDAIPLWQKFRTEVLKTNPMIDFGGIGLPPSSIGAETTVTE